LARVGVHWDLELSTLTEIINERTKNPGASRELKDKVANDWRDFLEHKTGEK
jgi:hypothetical protein